MEKITLNMTPSACLTTCHASQYDIGRQVRFDLVNGADAFVLSGAETVTLKIRRADGVLVENAVPNTSSNYVIWTSVAGECDAAGVSECELRVTDGDDVLGSANFLMSVEVDAYDGRTQVKSASGSIATFETALADNLVSALVNVEATGGNGTPDSPIPINGYTEANITRCGKNIFNYDLSDATYLIKYVQIKTGNGTFTMSSNAPLVEGAAVLFFLSGYQTSGGSTAINGVSNGIPRTVTTTDGYVTFAYRYYGIPTVSPADYDIQLEFGSTATAYAPYNGTTVTIAFGQTVYGGVLDVTRGKLHVTQGDVDIGSLNWQKDTSGDNWGFYINNSEIDNDFIVTSVNEKAHFITEIYEVVTANGNTSYTNNYVIFQKTNGQIFIVNRDYSDNASFKTAMVGKKLIYELATPFDIDLTLEVISAIVGTNNVYSNTNGDTTVQFKDSIQHYIDSRT